MSKAIPMKSRSVVHAQFHHRPKLHALPIQTGSPAEVPRAASEGGSMPSRPKSISAVDPVVLAIHEWRVARAEALLAETTMDCDSPAFEATINARSRTMARALTTVPTTRYGLRVFCEFGAELSMLLPLDSDGNMSSFSPVGKVSSDSRANDSSAEALFFRTLAKAATLLPAIPSFEEAHHE